MKTIAFHVEKGGTGKTTMSGNMAAVLSSMGKRVLLVDADPQGNLSSWFITTGIKFDLCDVLQGKADLKDSIINIKDGLDIIGTVAIDGELKEWSETTLFQKPYAFPDLLDQVKALNYDYCIFDLSPGISNLEKSILSNVNEVVGVLSAEFFSLDGLEIFENELNKLRKDRRATFTADKIIINRVNKAYTLHKSYLTEIEKLKYTTFTIGQNTAISDSVPAHLSLLDFDSSNKYIPELQRIAEVL